MGYFHYGQTLQDCEDALSAFREDSGVGDKKVRISPAAQECISKLHNEFEMKLADDLHTPTILNAALQEAFRYINTSVNALKAGFFISISPLFFFQHAGNICNSDNAFI